MPTLPFTAILPLGICKNRYPVKMSVLTPAKEFLIANSWAKPPGRAKLIFRRSIKEIISVIRIGKIILYQLSVASLNDFLRMEANTATAVIAKGH